ncbi:MAG: YCF48-related protein [Planctomycetota bacterium]
MTDRVRYLRNNVLLLVSLLVPAVFSNGCADWEGGGGSREYGGHYHGSKAFMVETYDGGLTWEAPCDTDKAVSFVAADVIDAEETVIITAASNRDGNAAVFRTDDWGINWTEVCGGYYDLTWMHDLAAGSLRYWAVAVGDAGAVFQTRDRGFSWSQKDSKTSSTLFAVDFYKVGFGPLKGFAVGEDGTIIRSEDAGDTWTKLDYSTPHDLFDVKAVGYFEGDEGLVVIVGDDGIVIRSEDTGDTWTEQQVTTNPTLNAVSFNERSVYDGFGIAVGEGGEIYKSSDDGSTWQRVATFSGIPLYDVHVNSAGNCVAVGKYHILHSADQGETWSVVLEDGGKRKSFFGIHFINDSVQGVAVGKTY